MKPYRIGWNFLFVSAVICFARASSYSQITNGGFEESGGQGIPGWSWGASSGKAKVTCEIVGAGARSGKYCLKLTSDQPAEPNVYGMLSRTIACEPMTEYQVTFYVKTEDHAGKCWYGGGRNWEWRTVLPSGTCGWTRIDNWYRTGEGETSFPFLIIMEGKAKGIWIDDVTIVRMGRSTDPTVQPAIQSWTKEKIQAELAPIQRGAAGWRERLENLRKQGAPIDYPLIKMSLVESFVPRIETHLKKDPKYLLQATIMIMELKDVAKGLEADLSKLEKDPKCFPAAMRYRTGRIERDGYAQIGNVLDPATGKVVRRPVIFTGYGCFHSTWNESAFWQDRGCNVISAELGPNAVVTGKPDGTLVADEKPIDEVVKKFQTAAANNVAVVFLISPHYMPLCTGSAYWAGDEPGVIDALEAYLRPLIRKIKDMPSLHSIVLSNEPNFGPEPTADHKHFYRTWRQFLRKKYGTVNKLNQAYGGTAYREFWEVPVPSSAKWLAGYYPPKDRPWFADAMECNNRRFAEWHRRVADVIHEEAPNVAVHAKLCAGYLQGTGLPMPIGIDPEMYAGFTQYAGYDDPAGLRMTMDVMTSFQKAPAVNSENHILQPDENYRVLDPRRFYADLFSQAMHGQFVSTAWCYEPGCEPMSLWDFSVRPACMEAYGRCGLDLMRAAPVLAAIQDTPRQVAILYSPTSFYYDEDHHSIWRDSWDAFAGTGLRVRFLSENQIQGREFGDTRVLILPEAQVVEGKTLEGLRAFIEHGGKVLTVGKGLEFTPGWVPVDSKVRVSLVGKEISITAADWKTKLVKEVRSAGIMPLVELVQLEGAGGIHYLTGLYQKQKVVALVNQSAKTVRLTINDPAVRTVFDVIHPREISLPATVESLDCAVWQIKTK